MVRGEVEGIERWRKAFSPFAFCPRRLSACVRFRLGGRCSLFALFSHPTCSPTCVTARPSRVASIRRCFPDFDAWSVHGGPAIGFGPRSRTLTRLQRSVVDSRAGARGRTGTGRGTQTHTSDCPFGLVCFRGSTRVTTRHRESRPAVVHFHHTVSRFSRTRYMYIPEGMCVARARVTPIRLRFEKTLGITCFHSLHLPSLSQSAVTRVTDTVRGQSRGSRASAALLSTALPRRCAAAGDCAYAG